MQVRGVPDHLRHGRRQGADGTRRVRRVRRLRRRDSPPPAAGAARGGPPPAAVGDARAASAQRAEAPPLPFVYVGKMKEQGSNGYMVFLERQNRVYAVRQGDAIDSNYRVDSIKAPLMTLTYLPMKTKQTLQIGEAN